jgi:hypothetical protein
MTPSFRLFGSGYADNHKPFFEKGIRMLPEHWKKCVLTTLLQSRVYKPSTTDPTAMGEMYSNTFLNIKLFILI